MSRRRVLYAWNYVNWGGAQIYFLSIIKLIRKDWDVMMVLPQGTSEEFLGFLDELEVERVFFEYALDKETPANLYGKLLRQARRIRSEISMYKKLRELGTRGSVVHIEAAPWQSWLLLTALVTSGANVFVTLHNFLTDAAWPRRLLWKARMRFLAMLPRFNVFTSNQDGKKRFAEYFGTEFSKTIDVTYTAVDPAQIADAAATADRSAYRKALDIPEDAFVILTVGQFIDRKGRWTLLDAAKKVLDEVPDALFLWLMPSLPDDRTLSQIEKYGLGDSFRPVLSADVGTNRIEILRFFSVADIFALPSFIEGLPIALLEAMALGIPSVSTNVFAIPEAIKHEQTGLLVESGNPAQLSDAVIRLARDPELRKHIAMNGREHVLRSFDENQAARTALQAYEKALGSTT